MTALEPADWPDATNASIPGKVAAASWAKDCLSPDQ